MSNYDIKLKRSAHYATIAACIVAILALFFGALKFAETQRTQAEALTFNLLQEHIKLAVEHPELATYKDPSEPVDSNDAYLIFAEHAIYTAETMYDLTDGDEDWISTVMSLIKRHETYILHDSFPCETYDAKFIQLIRDTININVCINE